MEHILQRRASAIRFYLQKSPALAFVQEFYDWYVPKARDMTVNSLDLPKERHPAFSARLIQGVETIEADARRHHEAGLDFDWILNTQNPGDPGDPSYLVRNSKLTGNVCRVDVYRQVPGGKIEKDVIPELNFEHGKWLVNFHYPDSRYPQNENLLSIIKANLDSISRAPKEPR